MRKSHLRLIITLAFYMLINQGAEAQGIFSVSIYPSSPSPDDSVKAIASVWLPSGDCWLQGAGVSVLGQDVNVYAGYDAGLLTVICYSTDTITLGKFNPGNYTCNYNMIYPYYTSVIDDLVQVNFTVSGTTGTKDPETWGDFIKVNRLNSQWFEIQYDCNEVVSGIHMINTAGQTIYSQKVPSAKSGKIPFIMNCNSGMIFVTLVTENGRTYTRKLILPL